MGSREPIRVLPDRSEGKGSPNRCPYLELHFLIHLQQRGHGRAGPCSLRWRPEALWAPGRGSEGRESIRLLSGRGCPRWLTGCSLARSLPPSVPPARPPACCLLLDACLHYRLPSRLSPLTPEVASQPSAGAPAWTRARVLCAAALRSGARLSSQVRVSRAG